MRGRKTKCIKVDPIHRGKLTIGKVYVVLDENAVCLKVRDDQNRRRYHDRDCFDCQEFCGEPEKS